MDIPNMRIGVSVIIPAKNEERHIGLCLESILCQEFDGPLEILVVDDKSTDNTGQIARSKGVQVIETGAESPAAVRNFGARHARHSILAFIDGDCKAPIDWVKHAVNAMTSDDKLGARGGPCIAPAHANWLVKCWSSPFSPQGKVKTKVLPGSNLIVWKEIFDKLDGFDESLVSAEDDEFCKRLIEAGYEIECDGKSAVVHYGYPDTVKDVLHKSIWHGCTQLRAHGFFGDKVVMLTWVWLLSVFFAIIFFIINSWILVIGAVAGLPIISAILAFARIRNFPFCDRLKYFVPACFVCCLVLSGRSIGMIRELIQTRAFEETP